MSLGSSAAGVELLSALARTANANGTGVDTWAKGRPQSSICVLSIGAASGTTPTLDVKIQDSADNSSWADVSGAAFAQKTAAAFAELNVGQTRRYIRAVGTVGGTTPSFTYAVIAVLGDPIELPA